MNIVEVIREETAGLPAAKVAVRGASGDLTYARLFQALETAASLLRGQGVGRGVRVGLSFPDSTDYIVLSLAVLSLDAVLVPVPVSAATEVQDEILEKTVARFLIRSAPGGAGNSVWMDCPALPDSGGFFLSAHYPERDLPAEFDLMEPAFIRFSSGTTGESKGVLLTHPAIIERTDAADHALQITPSDTVLWVLSMSFHFVVSILLFLRRGATISLCSEMFPFSFLSAVARGDATFIYATPFHYRTLIEARSVVPENLRNVRMAISTAMKLPPETESAFCEKFKFGLTEAYGIIEVGLPFINATGAKPAGSVGRALPGFELDIRSPDESGAGEVRLRGPGMYAAYLHPWRRRKPDEWFATGDTGRLDEDGFLTLLGRTKNLINFAGMKVFPYEVEAVLERFPGVTGALVFAESHPRYGQIPCAKVEASGVTADELQRHCYEHLESYKVPKKIELVDHLDRTASGKIRRN